MIAINLLFPRCEYNVYKKNGNAILKDLVDPNRCRDMNIIIYDVQSDRNPTIHEVRFESIDLNFFCIEANISNYLPLLLGLGKTKTSRQAPEL